VFARRKRVDLKDHLFVVWLFNQSIEIKDTRSILFRPWQTCEASLVTILSLTDKKYILVKVYKGLEIGKKI
jgi:hypothetical protein